MLDSVVNQRMEVFIDANLLSWMPAIVVKTTPSRFVRLDEQSAFEQLLLLRASRTIDISAWDETITNFLANQGEPVTSLMLSYFSNRISFNTTWVVAGEELAAKIDRIQNILQANGEQQDDVAVWVMSYIVRTQVTHLATCDGRLHNKWRGYLRSLESDKELTEYIEFRRRGKPYFVGFPSAVLDDIRARLNLKG